jgi:hypothetical protein
MMGETAVGRSIVNVGLGILCIALASAATAGPPKLPADVATADVCTVVPGADVARALGGSLAAARLVRPDGAHARCVYTVALAGPQTGSEAIVLWLHAAGDFEELRRYQDDPVSAVEDLGDAAFIAFHKDEGRFDLFVLLRGVATLEVTGPSAASVRKVAAAAIERLRPPR